MSEQGELLDTYYEHPLDKATYTLHLGRTLEELSTVGFVADHFVSFLEENFPELLSTYHDFEETALRTQHAIPTTTESSGYGTEVHVDHTASAEENTLFLSALEIYIQIYRQMKAVIPNLSELIADARANRPRSLSYLLQAIKVQFGSDILKQLLNYAGPYDQQGVNDGYRLLLEMMDKADEKW